MGYTGQQKRDYQNAWMQERRSAWIISQGGKCIDCSSTENLEIDHVDPKTKEFQPTSLWSRRKEIRDLELAKCVVRCHDCHLLKTIKGQETSKFKEDHHLSYLTQDLVDEIRNEYSTTKISIRALALKFNSKRSTIHDIIKFKSW